MIQIIDTPSLEAFIPSHMTERCYSCGTGLGKVFCFRCHQVVVYPYYAMSYQRALEDIKGYLKRQVHVFRPDTIEDLVVVVDPHLLYEMVWVSLINWTMIDKQWFMRHLRDVLVQFI